MEKFGFILGVQKRSFKDQDPVNIEAAELVGKLHDALEASGYTGHDLERFLVRIVFCLFADDTGIFEPRDIFLDFLENRTQEDGSDLGGLLALLFQVLDTPGRRTLRQSRRGPEPLPLRERGPVRRAAPHPLLRRLHARAPARRLPLRLVEHLSGHLRLPVPVRHGQGRAAKAGRPLHHRKEHPSRSSNRFSSMISGRSSPDSKAAATAAAFRNCSPSQQRLGRLRFLDPACGCGNFLIIAYRELRGPGNRGAERDPAPQAN